MNVIYCMYVIRHKLELQSHLQAAGGWGALPVLHANEAFQSGTVGGQPRHGGHHGSITPHQAIVGVCFVVAQAVEMRVLKIPQRTSKVLQAGPTPQTSGELLYA